MAITKRSIGEWAAALPQALWRRLRDSWVLVRARRRSVECLRQLRPRQLLVLCYGNIYRSPFVTACLGACLGTSAGGFEIRSAGFHPIPGRPSPRDFVALSRHYGVDLESHRSRIVVPADLEWADSIVIMDRYNWERLRPFGAAVQDKIIWLGVFAVAGPVEIEDPYALPLPRVRAIVEQMQVAADGLAHQLLAQRG